MHEHDTTRHATPPEQTELGMARFFRPENLNRYRKLASVPISADERQEIISILSKEMDAFKAEVQRAIASGLSIKVAPALRDASIRLGRAEAHTLVPGNAGKTAETRDGTDRFEGMS